jgi:hypothetical protein
MPELKIALPEKFTGVRNTTESFLSGCDLYLEINDAIYDSSKKKIGFILALLSGDALEWRTAIMETMKKNKGKARKEGDKVDETTVTFDDYDSFVKHFTSEWSEADAPGTALSKLKNLRVGRELSVTEYTAHVSRTS